MYLLLKDEGKQVISISATTPYDQLSKINGRINYRPEYMNDTDSELDVSAGARWTRYGAESDAGFNVNYLRLDEELEDFATKSTTKLDVNLRTPWTDHLRRAAISGRLVIANSNIEPQINLLFNDEIVSVVGEINVKFLRNQYANL